MNLKPINRDDLLLGGPGLDGYAYKAAIYCVDCGRGIIENLDLSELNEATVIDSSDCPQPVFFGESDTAEHCDACGEYCYGGVFKNETDAD